MAIHVAHWGNTAWIVSTCSLGYSQRPGICFFVADPRRRNALLCFYICIALYDGPGAEPEHCHRRE